MSRSVYLAVAVIGAIAVGACAPSPAEQPSPAAQPPSSSAQPPSASTEAPPPGGQPANFTLPAAQEFTLANGLQVTMVPYGEMPKAIVALTVTAGNADEAANETWLADLMGRMMDQGTADRSAEELAQDAAAMGGEVSVSVTPNQTIISGDALAEHVPGMVELVADVALNPSFPAGELERLKGDMLREVSIARSQPQSIAFEKFREVMYGQHPYGRIFPSDTLLQSYTLAQVRGFHDESFGAARTHLYVVGRFDAAAVEAAVRSALGEMERGRPADQPVPAPTSRRAVHLIDRPNAPQSTIILGLPVVDPSHPDWIALQVTNSLLGGSFGSRITSNIREDKGYTYSPFSSVSARPSDAYWAQSADVTTNVTGASLREIFYEINRLRDEPPSQEELAGIQNYLTGNFVLANSALGSITNQLAFVDLHGLPDDYLETYVQRVLAVTPADVQRIAREYLDPAQMQIVVVGDEATVQEQVAEFGPVVQ
jgi:zinc protease